MKSIASDQRKIFSRLGAVLERIPGFEKKLAAPFSPDGVQPTGWFEFKVGDQDHRVQFVLLPAGWPKRVRQLIHELEAQPPNGPDSGTYGCGKLLG